MATVVSAMAQYERRLIGERTKAALAARRAAGVRLGRPPLLDEGTLRAIVALREQGMSTPAIARTLTAGGFATATGGRWHPSTVSAALRSAAVRLAA